MTQPPPIPDIDPPSSPSPPTQAKPPACGPWVWPALLTAFVLVIAADVLTWQHQPGLGYAVFAAMLWTAIAVNRNPEAPIRRYGGAILIGLLGGATLAQTVYRPSWANLAVMAVLTLYLSARLAAGLTGNPLRVVLHSAFAFLKSPLRPLVAARAMGGAAAAGIRSGGAAELVALVPSTAVRRSVAAALPAAIAVIPFAILFLAGNAVIRTAAADTIDRVMRMLYEIRAPGPGHVVFWTACGLAAFGLLWRSRRSAAADALAARWSRSFPAPSDEVVARWRTRLVLLAVNLVFFGANTADAVYLWAERSLPAELTLAAFVHEGIAALIINVLIAGVLLGFLFRQDRSVATAPGQQWLAIALITQNLFLLSSVALRIASYIEGYGLSLLRFHLIVFLIVTASGFLMLAWMVVRGRSLTWLVGANAAAVLTAMFTLQFCDIRAVVANTNFQLAQEWKSTHVIHRHIDVPYLVELGPSAWPVLQNIARGTDGFEPFEVAAAQHALQYLVRAEADAAASESWEDFQYQRAILRRAVLGITQPPSPLK